MTWSHNAEVSVVSTTDFDEEAIDFHRGFSLSSFLTIPLLRCGAIETFIIRFGQQSTSGNFETRFRLFREYRTIIFYARARAD